MTKFTHHLAKLLHLWIFTAHSVSSEMSEFNKPKRNRLNVRLISTTHAVKSVKYQSFSGMVKGVGCGSHFKLSKTEAVLHFTCVKKTASRFLTNIIIRFTSECN